MCQIINDFIKSAKTYHGWGFFEGQGELVVKFANQVGKNQHNKFYRYNKIPKAFHEYLAVLDSGKTKIDQGFADHIRESILKEFYPDMYCMFGSGEKLGKDLYKMKNKLSLDKRQGYKH